MRLSLSVIVALWPGMTFVSQAHGQQIIHEIASADGVVQTASLCNYDAVPNPVDVSTITASGVLTGRGWIEVYNPVASTTTVNCGFAQTVSSTTNNANYGREVSPGTGVVFAYRQGTATGTGMKLKNLFCVSQNNTGCTRVTVTQIK